MMTIGILTVELSIPYIETIKERRNIIRSLKDMIRKKFNVSVSDVTEGEEITPRATLAVAGVSIDSSHIQSVLNNVFNLIENFHADKILSYKTDYMAYE